MSQRRQPTSYRQHGKHSQAGPHRRAGFDFTAHMRCLCDDIVARLPQLAHIELDLVAISFSQTRKAGRYGMHASLTPMRFDGGSMRTERRGQVWEIQRLVDDSGRDMLYILSFYLPRFLELDFHEKITTVIHELLHINPKFDGDVRRYGGRCYAHSHSGEHDAEAEKLADTWLSLGPPESVYRFLRLSFGELQERHGPVFGRKVSNPKLFRVN